MDDLQKHVPSDLIKFYIKRRRGKDINLLDIPEYFRNEAFGDKHTTEFGYRECPIELGSHK